MTERAIILLLTGLVWSTAAFSQDEIKVDILPSKISTDINMIVYTGQTVVLERYHFFKYNYWMSSIDTLETLENGMFQSKGIVINPGTFSTTVDGCDSIVNMIRNSAFQRRMSAQLRDAARKEIGYDSKEITDSIDVRQPTEYQESTICHDEFKVISKKWFDEQSRKVEEIRKKKIERRAWIKANPDKIDAGFIKLFLTDYSTCDVDQVAILDIIKFKTDDFLLVCKDMTDMDFFDVKLKLSLLPGNVRTNDAIEKLKASPIRTNRKGKLIKKMKKNAR